MGVCLKKEASCTIIFTRIIISNIRYQKTKENFKNNLATCLKDVEIIRWYSLGMSARYIAAKWQSGTQQRADKKLLCPMNLLIFEDNWYYYSIPCFSRDSSTIHITGCKLMLTGRWRKRYQFQSPSVPMSQRQMCMLCLKTPLRKANSKNIIYS